MPPEFPIRVMMLAALFVLWVLGWWTVGHLVSAYRKSIHQEELHRRRQGLHPDERHHFGAYGLLLLDALLLAPFAVALLSWDGARPAAETRGWIRSLYLLSPLASLLCIRAAVQLSEVYLGRARAWKGLDWPGAPRHPWSLLWSRLSLSSRALALASLILALGAIVWSLGAPELAGIVESVAHPAPGLLVLLPPLLLVLVFGPQVLDLRRHARSPA